MKSLKFGRNAGRRKKRKYPENCENLCDACVSGMKYCAGLKYGNAKFDKKNNVTECNNFYWKDEV